jgi:beta-lactamase class A
VRTIKVFLLFFVCFSSILALTIFFFSISKKGGNGDQIINPIIDSVAKSSQQVLSLFTKGVDQKIADSVAQSDGIYSVIVIDLKNNQTYSLNPDRTYNSASLYKLWVMAAAYQAIYDGKIKRADILTDSVENLNKSFNIASSEAELKSGTMRMTVNEALEKSITVSDNYSALLLTKKLGLSAINSFLKTQHLTHSKTSLPPVTTAADIALFYLQLYNHQLVNYESSSGMIELLKRQAINDRIPKYLPANIPIAHKTGELDTIKHDAGIVFTPKGDYILVMLSDTNDPQVAAEKMAQLSQQIYLDFTSSH